MLAKLITFIVVAAFLGIPGAFYVSIRRRKRNLERSKEMVRYRIVLPKRDSEKDRQTANAKDFKEAAALGEQMFATLHGLLKHGVAAFLDAQDYLVFELVGKDAAGAELGTEISFHVLVPPRYAELMRKQVTAFYPDAAIRREEHEPLEGEGVLVGASLALKTKELYPIRTVKEMASDPLNDLVNVLGHLDEGASASIQLIARPIDNSWMITAHHDAKRIAAGKVSHFRNRTLNFIWESVFETVQPNQSTPMSNDYQQAKAKALTEKTKKVGFEATLRVAVRAATKEQADMELNNVLTAFGQYEDPTLNGWRVNRGSGASKAYLAHNIDGSSRSILNTEELGSIWHLPDARYNTHPQIAWLSARIVPAPVSMATEGLLLGTNEYRGEERKICLTEKDRFRHLYIIGQTGMGKTQLQKVLVKQDLANGNGVCVVDPHGDFIDELLEWVPRERVDDVILFDPNDTARPIGMNLFEAKNDDEMEFIAMDAMNMMIGLFGSEIFGPRLQDYFRNGALTLMADKEEGGAITDLVRLFTDDEFQKYKVKKVTNPIIRQFWEKQMAATGQREKDEMIPFWAAKFGQFITNTTMRNIVGQTKSSIDISEAMDHRKIVLVKLAKGLVGEINANLLGMIFVNKIQVAAMRRASQPQESRVPFFLYVDEFQNFVTEAFESILSEARKYKLGLTIAHQYIAQLDKGGELRDKVKNAVFGNVGSMVSFKVGAQDAEYLAKEFAPAFSDQDLIHLDAFTTVAKISYNGVITAPFTLFTKKDFAPGDKVLATAITEYSRLKYGRDRDEVNEEILGRIGATTIRKITTHAG